MEDLNKHQLILLSLLISFVTSIATGIMTVTLLDQAPTTVTQTINRVVERTVERVVPGESVIKEVPVIVTEEELIVKAINNASPAVVNLVDTSDETQSVASGFLVEPRGLVVSVLPPPVEGSTDKPNYEIRLENGKTFPVEIAKTVEGSRIAVFKVKSGSMADFNAPESKVSTIKLSDKQTIVGQTIIGLGHSGASVSIVSAISDNGGSPLIKTNASTPDNSGGPLLDIHGEVVGVAVSSGSGLPKGFIRTVIDSIK